MLSVWFTMGALSASAADCTPHAANEVSAALAGATGLVVRGIEGDIEIVTGAGDEVRATGTVCTDAVVRLVRRGDLLLLSVKDGADAGLALTVTVPSTLPAVTVYEQAGRLVVRDVPTRLAVVSGAGPIDVTGATHLRISHSAGDVSVDRIAKGLIVDQLTGSLDVGVVGGDVVVDGVTGQVVRADTAPTVTAGGVL